MPSLHNPLLYRSLYPNLTLGRVSQGWRRYDGPTNRTRGVLRRQPNTARQLAARAPLPILKNCVMRRSRPRIVLRVLSIHPHHPILWTAPSAGGARLLFVRQAILACIIPVVTLLAFYSPFGRVRSNNPRQTSPSQPKPPFSPAFQKHAVPRNYFVAGAIIFEYTLIRAPPPPNMLLFNDAEAFGDALEARQRYRARCRPFLPCNLDGRINQPKHVP
jgi:hypothetical protein